MIEIAVPSSRGAPVQHVIDLQELAVGIVRETPPPAELFLEHFDLAVISDSASAPAFAKLFNSSLLSTAGFLTKSQLENIHACFAHRAKNPIRIFHLPRAERMSARVITERCSLLSLGANDRRFAHKYVLFVPSLAEAEPKLLEANSCDYVEAAMYVAGFTKSRAIYFAGFGAGDGSFSNESIVKLTARTYVARHALHLQPLEVYFKYPPAAPSIWVGHLATQLSRLEDAPSSLKRGVCAA